MVCTRNILERQFLFLRKMDKVFEFNPESVKHKAFKINIEDWEPEYLDEIRDQFRDPNLGCVGKRTAIPISDISDYSIFVKKNLSDAKGFSIKTKSSKWYKAKEILPSPSGSVIYFDEQIGKVFKKGCIYPVVIILPRVLTFKLIERITKDLFKKNHKSNWL